MSPAQSDKIRILVVDDSALVRKILAEALGTESDLEIVGVAPNGRLALEKVPLLKPDIVLLDLEMPEMDGLTTLKILRKQFRELPVMVFSTLSERGARITLEALSFGANDYLCKPSGPGGIQGAVGLIRQSLAPKLRALVAARRREKPAPLPSRNPAPQADAELATVPPGHAAIDAVAIGTSAGGPQALNLVVPKIPGDIGVPILLVQHMPATFTKALAERLAQSAQIRVVEAEAGMPVTAGTLYVAPGDQHMTLELRQGKPSVVLHRGALENGCRPAVDPLFRSAAAMYGQRLLAIVMTGMGSDGTLGARQIRQLGGRVWAQDRATSAIWGMAGSVVKAGLAERVFRLEDLSYELARVVKSANSSQSSALSARSRV